MLQGVNVRVGAGAAQGAAALLPHHLILTITPPISISSRFNSFCFRNTSRHILGYGHLSISPISSTLLLSVPQFPASHGNSRFTLRAAASSVGSEQYVEEPATKVKFSTSLTLPGCSSPLLLLGTGYREKVFAIIGVKVYAAGLYVHPLLSDELYAWKGKSAANTQGDGSLYNSIFQASLEKSLQIILVRDVDGKTFWDALDEAISPRIKTLTDVDESALSTFRAIFQGRPLKKGTSIFLTWLDNSKMMVAVSSDGLPSEVDAAIESGNVTSALFDVFLGDSPVSPSLKASIVEGLVKIVN